MCLIYNHASSDSGARNTTQELHSVYQVIPEAVSLKGKCEEKERGGAENKTKGLTNKITSELLILLRLTVLKAVAVFHYHPLKMYRANTSTSTSRPLSSPKHLSFLQREPASGCLFTEYLNGPDTFAGSFGQNDRSVSKDLVYCTEPRPTCQGTEF